MEKLFRDIFVNVVANLAAAAILYLLATAAGALPRNQDLQLTASTAIVSLFGGAAWALLARKIGRERLGVVLLFLPAGTYIILSGAIFRNESRPWWLAVANVLGGGVVLAAGLWLAFRYDQRGRHLRKRNQAGEAHGTTQRL